MGWGVGEGSTTVVAALGICGTLGICGGKGEALPADLPVYPGADKKAHSTTLGVTTVNYQVAGDGGAKVKGWYDAHMAKAYKPKYGSSWTTRRVMAGMHFDERVYRSNARGDSVRVEVSHVPGRSSAILHLVHCPKGKARHCRLRKE